MAPRQPTPAELEALKKSKGVKPTEALTNVGQKPTGLAKSSTPNRFASDAKTSVKNATSGFAGSGTPLGTSMGINPVNKGQITNAALTATALPGSGQLRNYVAGKIGSSVADSAFVANTAKGFEASGAGGKIKDVMTPMGKTIASTKIGSSAEQAARMGNLATYELQKAVRTGIDVGNKVVRGMNSAGNIVKTTAGIAVVTKGVVDKVKKK